MANKKIKITCSGSRYVPLGDLENFQGNLKTLPGDNFEKLKRLIIKRGFSFPVFVWGKNKILDGHQRLFVLSHMVESGEYVLEGDIPVCDIEAKTKKEAAEKLLELQGNYGKITQEGLSLFIDDFDVNINEIFEDLEITDLEISTFNIKQEQTKIDFGQEIESMEDDLSKITIFCHDEILKSVHESVKKIKDKNQGIVIKVQKA